jgi:hypothetical protein
VTERLVSGEHLPRWISCSIDAVVVDRVWNREQARMQELTCEFLIVASVPVLASGQASA